MSGLGIGRDMTRVCVVLFAAGIAIASVSGKAAKAANVGHPHKQNVQAQNAQAAMAEDTKLGAMRYFGGPKSPLWREMR